jgi:hypothetical protein
MLLPLDGMPGTLVILVQIDTEIIITYVHPTIII